MIGAVAGISQGADDAMPPCAAISAEDPVPDERCRAHIEGEPRPVFIPIPIDYYTLDVFQYWRATEAGTPLYAAPHGEVIGRTANGLVYFRINETSEDGSWLRNEEGQWLRAADLQRERASDFRGVQFGELTDGLRSFAWVLEDTQAVAAPGAVATVDSPELGRYELVYTFASVEDETGARWYLVGAEGWLPASQLAVVGRRSNRASSPAIAGWRLT